MNNYQFLIDVLGAENILESFAYFLGRNNCRFIKNDNRIYQTRHVNIPDNFSGLIFTGAHWKVSDNGKIIDSYSENIQIPKSNNFCQLFATFLWASKGTFNRIHNVKLTSGDYTNNIKKISELFMKYIDYMESFATGKKWLMSAIPYKNIGIKLIKKELSKLISNNNYAINFSNSY